MLIKLIHIWAHKHGLGAPPTLESTISNVNVCALEGHFGALVVVPRSYYNDVSAFMLRPTSFWTDLWLLQKSRSPKPRHLNSLPTSTVINKQMQTSVLSTNILLWLWTDWKLSQGFSKVHFSQFSDAVVMKYNEPSSEFNHWRRVLLILLCLRRCQAAQLTVFSVSHIYILSLLRQAQEGAYDVMWDVSVIHTHISSLTSPLPQLCFVFLISAQVPVVMKLRNWA